MTITIKEEITAIKEDVSFHIYCKETFLGILNNDEPLKYLDYVKFYLYLHLYLEIGIARIFRQIKYFNVYLKTDFKDITTEELDNMNIPDKLETLKDFIPAKVIEKISDRYNSFAEKRNAIAHGHNISEVISKNNTTKSKTKSWCNKEEMKNHIELYNKIVLGIRDVINHLPCLSEKGKKDLKNIIPPHKNISMPKILT